MYVSWSIRNVKFLNESFYNMRCVVVFITAVCLIFLLKLKWPKNKSVYDLEERLLNIPGKMLVYTIHMPGIIRSWTKCLHTLKPVFFVMNWEKFCYDSFGFDGFVP